MAEYVDSATVRLALIPSAADVVGGIDAATVRLSLSPSGTEQHYKFIPSFQVSSDKKWRVISARPKYTNLEVENPKRWLVSYAGKAPNVSGS